MPRVRFRWAWDRLNDLSTAVWVIAGASAVGVAVVGFVTAMPIAYAVMVWVGVVILAVTVAAAIVQPILDQRRAAAANPMVTIPEEEYQRLQDTAMRAPPPPPQPDVTALPTGRFALSWQADSRGWSMGECACVVVHKGGTMVGARWEHAWPDPAPGTVLHAAWPDDFVGIPDATPPSPGPYQVLWVSRGGRWVTDQGIPVYRQTSTFGVDEIVFDPNPKR